MTERRFTVIDGTPPPDTPAEQVRQRVRAMPKPKAMPQCHRCGGREYIMAHIGKVKSRLCVICLLSGQRVVM